MAYIRRSELTCTLSELNQYGDLVPLQNEAVYVVQPSGRRAVKFGDGKLKLRSIPYSINYDEVAAQADVAKRSAEKAKTAADSIYTVQKAPPFSVIDSAIILLTPTLSQIEGGTS